MKTHLILTFALIFALAACQLRVIHVSSSPTTVANPIYSSLRGGRMIYIKAVGHNPDPSQNLIYVGSFPCLVPSDGVTDTFISCETTDTGSVTSIDNQKITLISNGVSVTTSYPNSVYFKTWATPNLRDGYRRAGSGAARRADRPLCVADHPDEQLRGLRLIDNLRRMRVRRRQ